MGTMKLLHKNLEKDGAGSIVMVPEETEDMWHVFNLIAEGDSVRASTVRKVTSESNIGVRTAEKVRTTLTVRVEAVDESCFDTQVGLVLNVEALCIMHFTMSNCSLAC